MNSAKQQNDKTVVPPYLQFLFLQFQLSKVSWLGSR